MTDKTAEAYQQGYENGVAEERERAARILDTKRSVFGAKSLIGDSYTRGLIDALENGAVAIRRLPDQPEKLT